MKRKLGLVVWSVSTGNALCSQSGQLSRKLYLEADANTFCAAVPIFSEPEKQNCLALLVFVSLLWCTEALPLYVTSMLVPFLTVILRVLVDESQDPPHRLTPQEAAPKIFHTMFSQAGIITCKQVVLKCPLNLDEWSALRIKPSRILPM